MIIFRMKEVRFMGFKLLWVDMFLRDNLFGFGLCTIDSGNLVRSLLSIYYADGEWIIDVFWARAYTR